MKCSFRHSPVNVESFIVKSFIVVDMHFLSVSCQFHMSMLYKDLLCIKVFGGRISDLLLFLVAPTGATICVNFYSSKIVR